MGNEIAKNWDNKKEETPEQKFKKMYEEFKTDVIRSGILKEYKDHEFYIKPNQRRRIKIAESRMKSKQNQKKKRSGRY